MKLEIVSPKHIKDAASGIGVTAKRLASLLSGLTPSEERGMSEWANDPKNDGKTLADFQATFAAPLAQVSKDGTEPEKDAAAILTYLVQRGGGIVRVTED